MLLSILPRLQFVTLLMAISVAIGCGSDKTHFRSLDDTNGPNPEATADAAPQYLKTFNSGKLETANLKISSGFNLVEQDFSLVQAPKTSEISQQINRATFEDRFTQGNNGTVAQQSFTISEAGIFDLLIVIDNSSSMGPYQTRLSKNLPSILRYISNTNWRIAVVTSTSPCLVKTVDGRRYISRADYDSNPIQTEADFKKLIQIGEGGDPVEKGIKMAADAMTNQGCTSASNEWLRADSQRSVLLVTDEKNCGSGPNEGCVGMPWESANYFFDRVGYNVPFNAFLLLQEPPAVNQANPNDPNRECENSGGYLDLPDPGEYLRLVLETGGIYNDVCRSNYETVLEQISLNVRKKINIQFELTHPAVSTSLEISIDGKKINNFTVSGKTLTILETVKENAQSITVKYKHDPIPLVKNFKPSRDADGASFDVLINGEPLKKNHFHFDTNTGRIELNNIPPEYAQITIRYRDNIPLRKIFNYSGQIVADSLEVWVDEIKTTKFSHDANAKKIGFTAPPTDNQSISIRYELPGDRNLKYTVLGADAAHIENVKLIDRSSGEELRTKITAGQLELEHAAISNGRKVRAIYNMDHEFKDLVYTVAITAPPFPGSLKIDAEGNDKVCSQKVEIHENNLQFSCTDEDFENLNISYQYASDYQNSFNIAVDYSGPRTYKIYINGQETKNYQIIEENLIILKKYLPAGADVKVLIQPN